MNSHTRDRPPTAAERGRADAASFSSLHPRSAFPRSCFRRPCTALQVQASTSGVTIAEAVRQVLTDAITKPLSPSQACCLGLASRWLRCRPQQSWWQS